MGTEPFGFGRQPKNQDSGTLVQLKTGDRVLFQKYTGSEFRIGGVDCRVLLYDDILGIIRSNGAMIPPASVPTVPAVPETT